MRLYLCNLQKKKRQNIEKDPLTFGMALYSLKSQGIKDGRDPEQIAALLVRFFIMKSVR
jgi:hypothetical protein